MKCTLLGLAKDSRFSSGFGLVFFFFRIMLMEAFFHSICQLNSQFCQTMLERDDLFGLQAFLLLCFYPGHLLSWIWIYKCLSSKFGIALVVSCFMTP